MHQVGDHLAIEEAPARIAVHHQDRPPARVAPLGDVHVEAVATSIIRRRIPDGNIEASHARQGREEDARAHRTAEDRQSLELPVWGTLTAMDSCPFACRLATASSSASPRRHPSPRRDRRMRHRRRGCSFPRRTDATDVGASLPEAGADAATPVNRRGADADAGPVAAATATASTRGGHVRGRATRASSLQGGPCNAGVTARRASRATSPAPPTSRVRTSTARGNGVQHRVRGRSLRRSRAPERTARWPASAAIRAATAASLRAATCGIDCRRRQDCEGRSPARARRAASTARTTGVPAA